MRIPAPGAGARAAAGEKTGAGEGLGAREGAGEGLGEGIGAGIGAGAPHLGRRDWAEPRSAVQETARVAAGGVTGGGRKELEECVCV